MQSAISTDAVRPLDDEAGSLRELLRVATPLILSTGSVSLQYVVDRLFLTWYTTEALAAVLPAGLLHWTLMSIAVGTAGYVAAFIAQYEGAGRHDRVAAALWQGIYFSLMAGVLIVATLPWTIRLFPLFGHEPSIVALESRYFAILCWGAIPYLLAEALTGFYTGRGKTMVVLWVNVATTLTNIVLDYWWIFGGLGVAPMGVDGAAWATVAAYVVKSALFVYLMRRDTEARPYGLSKNWRFDRELFGRLLWFGGPNGFLMFMDVVCFSLFILLLGHGGTTALAATNLTFTLNTLAFIPMIGLGTAVMTLVGQRVGDGRPDRAERTTWLATIVALIYLTPFVAIYLLLPNIILMPYRSFSDPAEFAQLSELVVVLLRFVAAYCVFDGLMILFSFAIRGAGDTRFCFLFATTAGWLLLVAPTFAVYLWFDMDLMLAWWVVTVYVMVLAVGYIWRFRTGKWKQMRVIESAPELADSTQAAKAALSSPEPTAPSLSVTDAGRESPAMVEPIAASSSNG